MRLSLCMIVKDEERNIKKCLENVKDVVDEIIAVDTGSKDRTPFILKELGAKVYSFRWCDDFSKARNESLKYATGDYIIYLDADDRVSKEDAEKILEIKKGFPKEKNLAYSLKIVSESPDGTKNSAYQVRIFPKLEGVRFEYPIHEQIVPSLKRKGIKGVFTDVVIRHEGYKDPEVLLKKAERNLKILKDMLSEDPDCWFAHYFLAQTYEVLGEKELCEYHLKRSITEDCKRHDVNWYIGASLRYVNILLERGEKGKARDILLKLEEEFDSDLVKFFIAEMDMKEGDYRSALNRYVTINPERLSLITIPMDEDRVRYNYYLNMGRCYEELGYMKLAISSYENAYNRAVSEEEKAKSILFIVNFLIKQDKLNLTIPYLEEYIKIRPSFKAFQLLTLAYIKEKRLKDAERSIKEALYFSENSKERLFCLFTLAFIHISQFKIEEFILDTDLILKEMNLKAEVSSFQDLYMLYNKVSKHFREFSYWIEKIKSGLNLLISRRISA